MVEQVPWPIVHFHLWHLKLGWERGKEVTCTVKGEFVCWTNLSKLVDTCPLMAFIIMSIFSFIICMSWAIRIALTSNSNGRLVSFCPSRLLGILLYSRSSLSYRYPIGRGRPFCSSLSYSSSWSSGCLSFLWFSCCSNSWLHWVSHSTTAVRVCTCLSKTLEGFLVSSTLMVYTRFP